jgi:hypothetical protein
MRRWLVAVLLPFLLGGCPLNPPIMVKTITLNPTVVNPSTWYWTSSNSWCDVPLPGQGLWLEGTGPEPVGPGEAYSGYEDIYESGPPPFGCVFQQQRLYRGQVQFDLSQFSSVSVAVLTFNVDSSISENGGVHNDLPPNGYATTLGMSTGLTDAGSGPFYWYYDNDASLSCTGGIIKPNCSLAVGSQVSQWVTGSHPNFGFIIAGPILNFGNSLPSDNNGQVSWYSGFQLQVTYNPALNPNAPQ